MNEPRSKGGDGKSQKKAWSKGIEVMALDVRVPS